MEDNIQDLLNGGYNGLYNEVVTEDCYGLKQLKFIPDIIYDLGANVGIFTRYAHELFPNAKIVSVEPNEDNYNNLLNFTDIDNWHPINAAIGKGQLWHNLGAVNGSGESYVSSGIGYYHDSMVEAEKNNGGVEKSNIKTLTLVDLILTFEYLSSIENQKSLIKIDIEGGEHAIFQDEKSMEVLKKADYICMELHLYALTAGEMYDTMAKKMGEAIGILMTTHYVKLDNVHLWATKK